MTHTWTTRFAGLAAFAALAAGLAPATAAAKTTAADTRPTSSNVCSAAQPGYATCLAKVRTDAAAQLSDAQQAAGAKPPGYGANELRAAYGITGSGSGQTVAVIIAFDVKNAEKDLAVYRKTFGLPPCTTANGCFRKVNQWGGTKLPAPDPGWALEGSMDIQMVSAACPACKILLVEGQDNSLEALAVATKTAARLGAKVASHSYGADEFAQMGQIAGPYQNPAMPSVASSGDWGFTTAIFPAVLQKVTAVGGTSLVRTKAGWTEDAWWGAGSSCSAYIGKPSYQKDKHCAMRTVSDLSAVADPDTGVAVYDSYPNPFVPTGWSVLGGTSASAPLVAGMIGAAGAASSWTPAKAYQRLTRFKDVIGGSNGYCGGDYLCTGLKGYDAPTGVGSPRSPFAFAKS